ncbi:hypothetical protein PPERSA_08766 [Pseudocohnilembus persalinus]|uniref:Peptidase C13, legumain n=1 Tax=Pseudocohnilembus persalinus TaxID=266149 RepID=A0A0V0R7X8_PSEPJ|nr:hypothetical protein PPERSA_08766 [Pseudocohnilembus persalinus]|eukprot:KRX10464.1 hypothetical protein PPERSA_08766 [Pseudocohnilembus persalinus]
MKMKKIYQLLFLVFNILVNFYVKAEKFAFLTAGSKGYSNYRHQADVCHAYQILIKNGMSPENIIVMAYDDIAYNQYNAFPGTIYNAPTNEQFKGYNVYEGCQIDYKGEDVNVENFIAILTGDGEGVRGGNGKVFKTTENDEIFIYFSDHGYPGMISFPKIGTYLFAHEHLFKRRFFCQLDGKY